MTRRSASAQARGSWPSTSSPLWPSRTTVVRPPTAAATTGRAGRLRLGGDQAEGLVVGRYGDQRRGRAPAGELVLGDRRHEPHHVVQAEVGGQLGQRLGVLEAAAGRAADDRDDQTRAQGGRLGEQLGDRPQQHVGGLERLDPAGEEQHGGVGGQPELGRTAALS